MKTERTCSLSSRIFNRNSCEFSKHEHGERNILIIFFASLIQVGIDTFAVTFAVSPAPPPCTTHQFEMGEQSLRNTSFPAFVKAAVLFKRPVFKQNSRIRNLRNLNIHDKFTAVCVTLQYMLLIFCRVFMAPVSTALVDDGWYVPHTSSCI